MKILLVLVASALNVFTSGYSQQKKPIFPKLKGAYLGQNPPGSTAKLFAPEVISTLEGKEMCAAFTTNGKEFYFNTIYKGTFSIFFTNEVNGKWIQPEPMHFSSAYTDRDLTISPDGNKIFFGSNRPAIPGGEKMKSLDIYVVQREQSGEWSEPLNIGSPVNTKMGENYPSVASNGNLYYFSCTEDGWGGCDIYMSQYSSNRFQKPILLDENVNSQMHDWDAYVAPDESYLIFSSKDRPDSTGAQDLYISFKEKGGGWAKARNLGIAVNSAFDEICPSVTLDGKYLFFTSRRRGKEDIYWVSTKVIEELKP